MPLPEFHPESSQSKMPNYSTDLPFMHDEFAELLWDNGPIVMQGQSNRPRKSSFYPAFSSHNSKDREKDRKETTYPKIGHFTATEPKINNFSLSGHSVDVEVNAEDDDIVPWINYPIEDPLHNDDYCSEFLNEYSGAHPNSLNSQSNVVPTTRSNCFRQAVRDSHIVAEKNVSGPARIKTSQQFQLQSSIPCTKSRVSDTSIGNHSKSHKDSGGMAVMNFTHFSRPVALARADLQSANKLESNKMAKTGTTSNAMESTVVESSSGLKSVLETRGQQLSPVTTKGELALFSKPHQEVVFIEKSKAVHKEEASVKNNKHDTDNNCNRSPERIQASGFAPSVALGRHEAEKAHEAVVASSVCSGSSPGATSNDLKQTEKRKRCEGEESGYQSEDIEDDSGGLKKPTTMRATSTKRSRAAEVHNLSERRRRDRINEKMRALQELIPNCNKTDKASMLDEAIEYLKTLQMQVQIMSMGSGMCMPSMMMQHMRGPTMPHFSPMGVGMGMGMGLGYGLGMYDMNGSPRCPLIPVPPVHGPQFSCHSISGTQGYHHVPGSPGVQVYGIPGQGFPVTMPHRPTSGSLLGLSMKVSSVPDTSGITTSPAPVSNSKDQQQESAKLETLQQSDNSQVHTSTQAAEKCFEDSALVQSNDQPSLNPR